LFEKIIKTVLTGLKLTNHLIDHACISLRSALTLCSASAIFLYVSIKDVSSANRLGKQDNPSVISFKYKGKELAPTQNPVVQLLAQEEDPILHHL
jgi:hypothetical protein